MCDIGNIACFESRKIHHILWYLSKHSHCTNRLTHCGRVTHICVSKLTIIGSDDGLSPDRRQAIVWTNAGISLIKPFGTNFSEILSELHTFSLKKIHSKMSSGKWRPFCFGLNVLSHVWFLYNDISTLQHPHGFIDYMEKDTCIWMIAQNIPFLSFPYFRSCHAIANQKHSTYKRI